MNSINYTGIVEILEDAVKQDFEDYRNFKIDLIDFINDKIAKKECSVNNKRSKVTIHHTGIDEVFFKYIERFCKDIRKEKVINIEVRVINKDADDKPTEVAIDLTFLPENTMIIPKWVHVVDCE